MATSEYTKEIRRDYDKSCKILGKLWLDDDELRRRVNTEITKLKDELLAGFPLNDQPAPPDDAVFLLFVITPDKIIDIYEKVSRECGF
jgi:hypothetical protein